MNIEQFWRPFRRSATLGAPEPDFICAGMEKAATSWLYDQLCAHPDFWMPPVKELRYLHLAYPPLEDALTVLSHIEAGRMRSSSRSRAFLLEAAQLAGSARDLDRYAALFRFKGQLLSGDISPGYWRLKEQDITRLAARFPKLKVIMMLRDPVERAWSHICMNHRRGRFDASILEDAARFANWFAKSPVKRASFASHVPPRWAEAAPAIPFRWFFYDNVAAEPKAVRDEIIGFLGGEPAQKKGDPAPHYNRKAGFSKLPLTEAIRAVLVQELAGELRDCARVFGDPARSWSTRYGL